MCSDKKPSFLPKAHSDYTTLLTLVTRCVCSPFRSEIIFISFWDAPLSPFSEGGLPVPLQVEDRQIFLIQELKLWEGETDRSISYRQ